jgi:hypothetical protein
MIGLYHLPVAYISADTGIPFEGASKGLRRLCEAGFCAYDSASEVVWVYEMARYQIAEKLKPGDLQCKGVQNAYDNVPQNPYLARFFERYAGAYHMANNRGQESPIEAPSKPLRSQEQEQESEQEQEQEQEQESSAPPPSRTGSLCKRLRAIGIQAAPHQFQHPDWQSLLNRFDDEAILGAAELAKTRKPGERIGINYLVPILNDPPKPPPAATTNVKRYPGSGRQAAIDNYAAQAAAARGEDHGQPAGERDITGEATRVA